MPQGKHTDDNPLDALSPETYDYSAACHVKHKTLSRRLAAYSGRLRRRALSSQVTGEPPAQQPRSCVGSELDNGRRGSPGASR